MQLKGQIVPGIPNLLKDLTNGWNRLTLNLFSTTSPARAVCEFCFAYFVEYQPVYRVGWPIRCHILSEISSSDSWQPFLPCSVSKTCLQNIKIQTLIHFNFPWQHGAPWTYGTLYRTRLLVHPIHTMPGAGCRGLSCKTLGSQVPPPNSRVTAAVGKKIKVIAKVEAVICTWKSRDLSWKAVICRITSKSINPKKNPSKTQAWHYNNLFVDVLAFREWSFA